MNQYIVRGLSDNKYNGWTNYETWNVKLWIDNEQGSSEYWQERAQEAWDNTEAGLAYPSQTHEQAFLYALAEMLKDEHEENIPELQGTFADLLGAALSEVNWYEIAEHYLDDIERDEDMCTENDFKDPMRDTQ